MTLSITLRVKLTLCSRQCRCLTVVNLLLFNVSHAASGIAAVINFPLVSPLKSRRLLGTVLYNTPVPVCSGVPVQSLSPDLNSKDPMCLLGIIKLSFNPLFVAWLRRWLA